MAAKMCNAMLPYSTCIVHAARPQCTHLCILEDTKYRIPIMKHMLIMNKVVLEVENFSNGGGMAIN